ncbi:MAG: CxxC-x17-CxxC domain-containing protein [Candidatus Paceibacterota bacterium]
MGNFKQGGGGFNKRSGGKSGFFKKGRRGGSSGGGDRKPITLHEAVCDQCGNPCEIPFRPTPGKLVYCNECFKDKREDGSHAGDVRFSPQNTPRFQASVRMTPNSTPSRETNDVLKKQLELLNEKMDQLIQAVKSISFIKPVVVEKGIKKEIKEKIVANTPKKSIKKELKK